MISILSVSYVLGCSEAKHLTYCRPRVYSQSSSKPIPAILGQSSQALTVSKDLCLPSTTFLLRQVDYQVGNTLGQSHMLHHPASTLMSTASAEVLSSLL